MLVSMSLRPDGLVKKSRHTLTPLTRHHGTHQRTDTTETTLGPGRSPLNSPSVRSSPHPESPADKEQQHQRTTHASQRGCRRDAAPTDQLGRRRPRGRAVGAGAGARGAAAISSNPEAAARRFENRGDAAPCPREGSRAEARRVGLGRREGCGQGPASPSCGECHGADALR